MKYDLTKHRRRSIRLKDFDYSRPGAYFVTVVTQGRLPFFGNIVDGQTRLSDEGVVTCQCWQLIAEHFSNVSLDEFVVMPNHLHGIVIMEPVGARHAVPLHNTTEHFGAPLAGTIPTIIRSFKSAVTKEIRNLQKKPVFRVRQRNYYEHVIRSEESLSRIREYITNNPFNWESDPENPSRPLGLSQHAAEAWKV